MSKIVRVNEPKDRAVKTTSLLMYADFVKASNKVDKKIDKLLKLIYEQS